jgi:hypothetical protein
VKSLIVIALSVASVSGVALAQSYGNPPTGVRD